MKVVGGSLFYGVYISSETWGLVSYDTPQCLGAIPNLTSTEKV